MQTPMDLPHLITGICLSGEFSHCSRLSPDSLRFPRSVEKGHGSNEPFVIEGSMQLEDKGWKEWTKGLADVARIGWMSTYGEG